MEDVRKTKYAEFLENMINHIMANKPRAIAVAYIVEDGGVGCGYFDCSMCDKLTMSGMIQHDATMDDIAANPEWLKEILEEED